MRAAAEIHRQAAFGDTDIAIGRRGVAASSNKSGNRIYDDGANGNDISIPKTIQRIIFRTADTGVEQNHIRITPRPQEACVQIVNFGIVSGGSGNCVLHRHVGEARWMGNRIHHAQRHNALTRRGIGGDQKPIELIRFARQIGGQQQRPEISGGANLKGDIAFIDETRKIFVRHGGGAAVDVK